MGDFGEGIAERQAPIIQVNGDKVWLNSPF